jgi:Flp pilus assembly CpaF family ATPase
MATSGDFLLATSGDFLTATDKGTGEISLRHLAREALCMRPRRIVVGEVRRQECLDLLIALNSGRRGRRRTVTGADLRSGS